MTMAGGGPIAARGVRTGQSDTATAIERHVKKGKLRKFSCMIPPKIV